MPKSKIRVQIQQVLLHPDSKDAGILVSNKEDERIRITSSRPLQCAGLERTCLCAS